MQGPFRFRARSQLLWTDLHHAMSVASKNNVALLALWRISQRRPRCNEPSSWDPRDLGTAALPAYDCLANAPLQGHLESYPTGPPCRELCKGRRARHRMMASGLAPECVNISL